MATGCLKYDIQEYIHPTGWESRLDTPFRAVSDDEALGRYRKFARGWTGGNLRLVKLNVLHQDNFTLRHLETA